MLLDEGTCLFNFDPHQVNIINLISQSVFLVYFIMSLIIRVCVKGLHRVIGVAI